MMAQPGPRMEIANSAVRKRGSPLPQWVSWSHGILLAVTLAFWAMFLFTAEPLGFVYKRDFLCLYIGARAVAEGHGPELYNDGLQWALTNAAISPYHRSTLLPYIYPAYVAVLLSPLGKLSLVNAFFVWTGINLLAAVWVTVRLVGFSSSLPQLKIPVLVAVLGWMPLQLTISMGQVGMLSTLALIETLLSLLAHKPWKAGCWLALGLVKPHLILIPVLTLLIWQCWPTLASFVVIGLVTLGLSFAKAGFWLGDYLRFLSEFYQKGKEFSYYPFAMQNWRGLVYALLRTNQSVAAYLLLGALSAASIVLVVMLCARRKDHAVWWRRTRSFPSHWKQVFSISILLGPLVSPYLYFHDWVIALPALIILFLATVNSGGEDKPGQRLAIFLRWLIALSPFVCFAVEFQIWPSASRIQLMPWYMGLLTTVAYFFLRNSCKTGLEPTSSPTSIGHAESHIRLA